MKKGIALLLLLPAFAYGGPAVTPTVSQKVFTSYTSMHKLSSGKYTPTATAVTNVAGVTPQLARWTRVNDIVTVSGTVLVTASTSNNNTSFHLSLPVPSDFNDNSQCSGTAYVTSGTSTGYGAGFLAAAISNEAVVSYRSIDTFTRTLSYFYTYEVR